MSEREAQRRRNVPFIEMLRTLATDQLEDLEPAILDRPNREAEAYEQRVMANMRESRREHRLRTLDGREAWTQQEATMLEATEPTSRAPPDFDPRPMGIRNPMAYYHWRNSPAAGSQRRFSAATQNGANRFCSAAQLSSQDNSHAETPRHVQSPISMEDIVEVSAKLGEARANLRRGSRHNHVYHRMVYEQCRDLAIEVARRMSQSDGEAFLRSLDITPGSDDSD